jgi:O-antigen/teichoic acid export membrane protein
MWGGILSSILLWSTLLVGGGLYAIPAGSLGGILVTAGYLWRQKRELLRETAARLVHAGRRGNAEASLSWRREVWPMQWRIALSWVSGYFIFQMFNPILFRYHGAEAAGRMGMTLTISNTIVTTSLAWFTARNPEFGKLIALRRWEQLDRLFFRVLRQTSGVSSASAGALLGMVWVLRAYTPLGSRLLSVGETALLLFGTCALVPVNAFAVYLRAHKNEPLLLYSLAFGVIQGVTAFVLGKAYGTTGIVLGLFAVQVFGMLPSSFFIWRRCRATWHLI